MQSADPYMRIVMFFDRDETAGSFLREDGEGGFTGALEQMAREIDMLRSGIKRLSDEEELVAETGGEFSLVSISAKLAAAEAENAKLQKMMASLDCYWPEDDTSSEACADGPWQIAENHSTGPGEVFGYSRGGVIETRYFGYLDPAEDADSDDNFEVDEPTQEAAEAKIAAELTRRAALTAKDA